MSHGTTFTPAQWKSLAIVPHVTGALSITGDFWVLFDVLWRRKLIKKKPLTTYHRIIMGMNAWDLIVVSLGFSLATWPMPRGTDNVYYASGTRQTCTMQGFFTQLSVIVKMYNAITAWYYLLVVRYGLSNSVIQQKYEKWMHIIPTITCLSFAVIGLVPPLSLYSPSTLWCWVNAEPYGCTQSWSGKTGTPCIRGDNAFIYRLAIFYGPTWTCIIFATICMIVIYNTVQKQEEKSERFRANRFSAEGRRERKKSETTKEVAKQAYFYIGGFLLVWTPPTVARVLQFFCVDSYIFILLMAIFLPLEGFVNSMVYARPRLIRHMEKRKQMRSSMGEQEDWTQRLQTIGSFFFTAREGTKIFPERKVDELNISNTIDRTDENNKEDEGEDSEEEEEDGDEYGTYLSQSQRSLVDRPSGLTQHLLEEE